MDSGRDHSLVLTEKRFWDAFGITWAPEANGAGWEKFTGLQ